MIEKNALPKASGDLENENADERARATSHNASGADAGETGETLKRKNNLVKSFGYATSGVAQASSERNFKVDVVAAFAAFAACAVLQVPAWGWAVVAVCVGVQLAMETMNTAIEAIVDLASPGIHPLAKRAKDCAAGAALITACASVVAGLIVFVPALLTLLGA